MRVLHLLSSNEFSGAENVACQIINMFNNKGEGVEMAYCSPDGKIGQILKEKGIAYYSIKRLSKKEIKRVIKDFNPDVIHAHDMKAGFYSAISQKKARIISHIHNSDFSARKLSVKSILFQYATRRIEKIIWVSDSCYETYYYSRRVKNKSLILRNVINKEELLEKAKTDLRNYDYDVVYVGRLAEPKNPLRLIEILKDIAKANRDIKVGIIGSGSLEEITKRKVEEYGLSENIEFLGYLSNPYKILSSSKVMLMTSDREGLPMVALEAMALGVPIVSTPTDGMNEIVIDGYNGYLCDENERFISVALNIINNNALREEISSNVQKQFSVVNDIERYYLKVKNIYEL